MTPKNPSTPADFHTDDAPDLSAAEWRDRFSKVLLASTPLDGVDLERPRGFGREVQLNDAGAPIPTQEGYRAALQEIERYFREEPNFGTSEAARFDQLAELIRLYENAHWPITLPGQEE